MERLTTMQNKVIVHKDCRDYCSSGRSCVDCEKTEQLLNRLFAYEDTGLEPDEITTTPYGCAFYCNRRCNLNDDWCAEGPGCPNEMTKEQVTHLRGLLAAEKDGRLVVLPCKVGDEIYLIEPADCKDGRCPDCDTKVCKYSAYHIPDEEVVECQERHLGVQYEYVDSIATEEDGTFCINGFLIVGPEEIFKTFAEAEAALTQKETRHN